MEMAKNTPLRLFIMMFLQYFMQGAWNMTLGLVLSTFGMSEIIGASYGVLGLATILSPLFVGMVADRFFPAQKVLGILHIINAGVLLSLPMLVESHNNPMFLIMLFIVGMLFYPTSALANSISFSHINGVKLFPVIRVFGTFGFITIGFILGEMGLSASVIVWYVASAIAITFGFYCFTLPETPPKAKGQKLSLRDLFFLDALSLFKDRYFSIYMLCTLFLMIPKTTYVAYVPVFLKSSGFDNAATLLQIGSVSEILFMFILSFCLHKFGFKKVIVAGAIGWIFRCLLLSQASLDNNAIFIFTALILHGICWDFFFTAGDIYVDSKASEKIRSQAQSLRFIVSNGFGVMFASFAAGKIFNTTVTDTSPDALMQWQSFWIYPMIIAVAVSIVFLLFFKDEPLKNKENCKLEEN